MRGQLLGFRCITCVILWCSHELEFALCEKRKCMDLCPFAAECVCKQCIGCCVLCLTCWSFPTFAQIFFMRDTHSVLAQIKLSACGWRFVLCMAVYASCEVLRLWWWHFSRKSVRISFTTQCVRVLVSNRGWARCVATNLPDSNAHLGSVIEKKIVHYTSNGYVNSAFRKIVKCFHIFLWEQAVYLPELHSLPLCDYSFSLSNHIISSQVLSMQLEITHFLTIVDKIPNEASATHLIIS